MTEPPQIEEQVVTGPAQTPERLDSVRELGFSVRPMKERDIAQAAEIERDAFPSTFPYTAFQHELRKKIAHYLVAWRPDDPHAAGHPTGGRDGRPLIHRLMEGARDILQRRYSAWTPGQPFIAGFLGSWHIGENVHIVSLGVRRDYRARGIGEVLLIGAIRQAMRRRASTVMLEVRPSNHVARNLYSKYGFEERGVRKSYYSDNREDAIAMITAPIDSDAFVERFEELVESHQIRWGRTEIVLG